jgi:hypothetical protein
VESAADFSFLALVIGPRAESILHNAKSCSLLSLLRRKQQNFLDWNCGPAKGHSVSLYIYFISTAWPTVLVNLSAQLSFVYHISYHDKTRQETTQKQTQRNILVLDLNKKINRLSKVYPIYRNIKKSCVFKSRALMKHSYCV